MQFSDKEISDLYKNIGKKVKELRELKNVTQLELSLDMGYKSVSLVSAAELCNDGKHFNIEHLYKISKILDEDIVYFFKWQPTLYVWEAKSLLTDLDREHTLPKS